MNKSLKEQLKKVKLLILDVDGVLTNGEIVVNDLGQETKIFNVQDGFGIVIFRKAGLKTAIISARASKAVRHRAKDLGIDKVYLNSRDKVKSYKEILKDLKMKDENVCFIGDDLPDLALMNQVGVKITVPNARPEIKRVVQHVTKKQGGQGAVREVIELILKTQGRWKKIVESMS